MIDFSPEDIIGPMRVLMTAIYKSGADLGIELPERSYLTTGGAVYDCPQVTISANALAAGPSGAGLGMSAQHEASRYALSACDNTFNVELDCSIVRAAREMATGPRGQIPPKPAQIEHDAFASMGDAACLIRATMSVVGGDKYGTIPITTAFGEVAGGLTAVVASLSINLWSIEAL